MLHHSMSYTVCVTYPLWLAITVISLHQTGVIYSVLIWQNIVVYKCGIFQPICFNPFKNNSRQDTDFTVNNLTSLVILVCCKFILHWGSYDPFLIHVHSVSAGFSSRSSCFFQQSKNLRSDSLETINGPIGTLPLRCLNRFIAMLVPCPDKQKGLCQEWHLAS